MGHYGPSTDRHASTYLPPALAAFPSPASTTASLSSPRLDRTLAAFPTPCYGVDEAAATVPTEPGSTTAPPLMSPSADEPAQPDMNLAVGGALAPTPSLQPVRPPARTGPGLRLPSFDELGIAAPHPDRHGLDSLDRTFSQAAREAMREPFSAPHVESSLAAAFHEVKVGASSSDDRSRRDAAPCPSPGRAIRAPVPRYIETLTPPAEHHEPDWSLIQAAITVPMDSPGTDLGAPVPTQAGASPAAEGTTSTLPSRTAPSASSTPPRAWYDGAVDALRKHNRPRTERQPA